MLPRFSIAVRRRTSTPWRAIIEAPRDRLTLRIAGSSSGLSPTASAIENSSVSIGGRPRTMWAAKTSSTMISIDAGQQVAEATDAAVELGFRRREASGGARSRQTPWTARF